MSVASEVNSLIDHDLEENEGEGEGETSASQHYQLTILSEGMSLVKL